MGKLPSGSGDGIRSGVLYTSSENLIWSHKFHLPRFVFQLFVLPEDEQEDKALLYSLLFLAVGVATMIAMFLQVRIYLHHTKCHVYITPINIHETSKVFGEGHGRLLQGP